VVTGGKQIETKKEKLKDGADSTRSNRGAF